MANQINTRSECKHDEIDILKSLIENNGLTAPSALLLACKTGQLDVLKCLHDTFNIKRLVQNNKDELLRVSLYYDKLQVANYLRTVFDLKIKKNDALLEACTRGRLETVKCLCEDFGLSVSDLRANNNEALALACINERTEVVEYLQKAGLSHDDCLEVNKRIGNDDKKINILM